MNALSLANANINYDNNILNREKRNHEGEISTNDNNSLFSVEEEGSPSRTEENSKSGINFKQNLKFVLEIFIQENIKLISLVMRLMGNMFLITKAKVITKPIMTKNKDTNL